jgi:hypothetical protein
MSCSSEPAVPTAIGYAEGGRLANNALWRITLVRMRYDNRIPHPVRRRYRQAWDQ